MRSRDAVDASAVFAPAAEVADAILYEGYLLYPYRKSSAKNKVRWQFGVLLPRGWAEAHGLDDTGVAGSAESWWQQTECLLAGRTHGAVQVRLRFLQLQRRIVEQRSESGAYQPVDRVVAAGRELVSFDEAVPREAGITASLDDLLSAGSVTPVDLPAGSEVATVMAPDGGEVARIVRRREAVSATVRLSAQQCDTQQPLLRLRVRVENTGGGLEPGVSREAALGRALIATHTLIAASGELFLSLLNPPPWASAAARGCRNVHTFPVLAGPDSTASAVLSSPIILYDHPHVAPESPGSLHDATEIDEILSLRTLTLTEQEKAEARATDAQAAAIVDRVDAMAPETFGRLHGAVRSLTPVNAPAPGPDGVVVGGVRVRPGSRVRLRPRAGGTDAHDMFLAGRTALVEAILADVDGACHVVVTVEDDPAAELNRWYGRFRYFRPDEVEPIGGGT